MSYLQLTVVGHLGRDPEMRYMPDGTAVTNFSVATTDKWTSKDGEKKEKTTWVRVSVWGRQAETVNQYLSKGRQVLVVGTLEPDPETGGPRMFARQDGSMGTSYEMRALTVRFLSGGGEFAAGGEGSDAGRASSPDQEKDEIPF